MSLSCLFPHLARAKPYAHDKATMACHSEERSDEESRTMHSYCPVSVCLRAHWSDALDSSLRSE